MALPGQASAQPFFLQARTGSRFCLFHRPAGECRAALVYLHPFAEEMNKSRRMAGLAARALAAQGVAVLQMDLHGCGDSSGEFRDARWESWKEDALLAATWLRGQAACPVGLWGLRLGALLALDAAALVEPDRILLWHPVLKGEQFLTQFLRLRLASDMLQSGADSGGTKALRAQLKAGETLEIAGYELAPALASAMDTLDAAQLAPSCPVDWLELGQDVSPASSRVIAAWGGELAAHAVPGPQFWCTQEIEDAPALVDATTALLREAVHA
ncbi:MAG TPA: hydrolase 2, exosortase A system-associated [Telluria sp.]|nr:hydrolase 2, exosortase A system-associated [Telluria sp.]